MYPAPPPLGERPIVLALPAHRVLIVWLMFGLNIAMFGLSMLSGFSLMGTGENDTLILIELGAKYTPLIDLSNQWWRLATATILHGGLIHLLVNSWALYALGPEVERLYGSFRFSVIYLVSGLAGSVGSYALGELNQPSIGASGALFGLMGALAAFAFSARATLGDLARRNLRQIAGIAVINLIIGVSIPGIDNYAHIGGLVGGALVGASLAPRLQMVEYGAVRRIEPRPSSALGWVGVLVVALCVAGLALIMHQQHLANDGPLLQRGLAGYYFDLSRFR